MSDHPRANLVVNFICGSCGAVLSLCSDPRKISGKLRADEKHEEYPCTGAYMIRHKVYVNPCSCCIRQLTEPARMVADGMKELMEKSNDR